MYLKCKRPRIAKVSLIKRTKWRLILPYFKTYYLSIEIKTVWYRQEDSHMDQYIGTENPELDLHVTIRTT